MITTTRFYLWSSVFFSLGLHRSFPNREVSEVTSFLSLIENFDFRQERKDVWVWSHLVVFSFSFYLTSLPLLSRFLTLYGG